MTALSKQIFFFFLSLIIGFFCLSATALAQDFNFKPTVGISVESVQNPTDNEHLVTYKVSINTYNGIVEPHSIQMEHNTYHWEVDELDGSNYFYFETLFRWNRPLSDQDVCVYYQGIFSDSEEVCLNYWDDNPTPEKVEEVEDTDIEILSEDVVLNIAESVVYPGQKIDIEWDVQTEVLLGHLSYSHSPSNSNWIDFNAPFNGSTNWEVPNRRAYEYPETITITAEFVVGNNITVKNQKVLTVIENPENLDYLDGEGFLYVEIKYVDGIYLHNIENTTEKNIKNIQLWTSSAMDYLGGINEIFLDSEATVKSEKPCIGIYFQNMEETWYSIPCPYSETVDLEQVPTAVSILGLNASLNINMLYFVASIILVVFTIYYRKKA